MTWSVSVSASSDFVMQALEREFARVVSSGGDITFRDVAAIKAEIDRVLSIAARPAGVNVTASGHRTDGSTSTSASIQISVSAY